jgi:hypothetical protein
MCVTVISLWLINFLIIYVSPLKHIKIAYTHKIPKNAFEFYVFKTGKLPVLFTQTDM